MPKAPTYQGKSSWARAPARDTDKPLTQPKEKPLPDAPFRPILESNKDGVKLRKKVRSSKYGKRAVKPRPSTAVENVPTREEQELEGATFRPKLSKSKESIKLRQRAASSGYGKSTPRKKSAPSTEKPAFAPAIGISPTARRINKTVGSSGYGKVIAEKPKPPKEEKPSFKPDLDVSWSATKLRESAPSGTYLQPRIRPDTAPSSVGVPKIERVQMHTLLSDRDDTVDGHQSEDEDLEPFVLDCASVVSAVKIGGVLPTPEPVKVTRESKRIMESVQSSGYTGNDYSPVQLELPEREPVESLKFGTANTVYVDHPDLLEPPTVQREQIRLRENAANSGYGPKGNYEPKHTKLPDKDDDALSSFVIPKRDHTLISTPSADLPVPRRNTRLSDRAHSAGYGSKAYEPPVVTRPSSPPKMKPMKMGVSTTAVLPVSLLGTAAERDLAVVRTVTAHGSVFEGEQTSILASGST